MFGLAKIKNMVDSREKNLCQYMEAHRKETPQAHWAVGLGLEAPAVITPGRRSSHPPRPVGGCWAGHCFAEVWQITGQRPQALRSVAGEEQGAPSRKGCRAACTVGRGALQPALWEEGLCEETRCSPSQKPSWASVDPH